MSQPRFVDRLCWTLLLMAISFTVFAMPSSKVTTRAEYIELYKNDAIRGQHESGVPASITLAQGILESGDGNSPLARKANNHFGIKCHSMWTGPTYKQDDDARNECFRKYKTAYESFRDHADFLSTRPRYAFLFDLKPTDYKSWCHGLKKAGYATNPKYAPLLIRIIEENQLYRYDTIENTTPLMASKNRAIQNGQRVLAQKRVINVHENNIKFAVVRKGDSFYKLAREFEMGLWQLYKYNDLEKGDVIHPGDIIYLQPKRRKARTKFHTVRKGETVRDISQEYGIRIKAIQKKNNLVPGVALKAGQRLSLRKRVPYTPVNG